MRCDVCGSSDNVFFIRPDGVDGELRLCRACAVARGYASIGEGLGAKLDSLLTDAGDVSASVTCPSCSWSVERLRLSGKLGCPACATAFKREILSILKRSGRSGPYDGKAPRWVAPVSSYGLESKPALSVALETAIEAEDFEAAASIRDRLRAISDGGQP